MASTLKQIKVQDKNADGTPKVDADKNPVMKDVAERFKLEFWMGNEYNGVEAEAFAYPCLTAPARGALSAQEETKSIRFVPSASLQAAILKEAQAAVNKELAK